MPSTTFDKSMLPKINVALKLVLENKYGDFYKKKYAGINIGKIKSYEDFQKIPILTKKEILEAPLKKRTLINKNKIHRYSISSGIEKKNLLVLPQFNRIALPKENMTSYEYGESQLESLPIKKLLVMWPPTSFPFSRYLIAKHEKTDIINGNINNLELSAYLAKQIAVDGIASTQTVLTFLVPHLKKVGFNFKKIRWISLGGEFCSSQKATFLKSVFPNAFISFRFGSSEVGGIGYRCKFLTDNSPNIFHPSPRGLIEIDNGKDDHLPGEIIYTTFNIHPFPLMRYRTGDIASLKNKKCSCGCNQLLRLGGRTSMDFVKISGTTIHIQAIESALATIEKYIDPHFQLHIWEKKIGNKLKIKLEFNLKLKKEYKDSINNTLFLESIIKKISDNLRLGKKSNLSQLVEQNIFLPLSIKFIKEFSQDHHKTKNIISHLE